MIPLWLDLGGLRVVHACWDVPSMDAVKPLTSPNGSLTEDLVIAATREPSGEERATGTPTPYDAIENLLKGPEVPLGDDRGYLDKDGNPRHRARFRWWDPEATTLDHGGKPESHMRLKTRRAPTTKGHCFSSGGAVGTIAECCEAGATTSTMTTTFNEERGVDSAS